MPFPNRAKNHLLIKSQRTAHAEKKGGKNHANRKACVYSNSYSPCCIGRCYYHHHKPNLNSLFRNDYSRNDRSNGYNHSCCKLVDDSNNAVTTLPTLAATDTSSYYVNGLVQQSSLFTLSSASLVISSTDISVGVPVIVEISNFSGTASTIKNAAYHLCSYHYDYQLRYFTV